MLYFAAFGVALATTMALIPPLIRFSGKLGLLDQPGMRKVHAAAVPCVGGIGMVLGVLLPVLLWAPLEREIVALLTAIGVLFVFGLWDDRGDLDYRLKFLGQILAALVVVGYGDVVIEVLPFFGIDPVTPWLSMPLTVFTIVAVTNSVNLADGLDGLAAGMMLLTLVGVALLTYVAGGMEILLIVLAVMGVITGFLRFNTYPARVFMGDTGSQFLGFTVSTLLIILTQQISPVLSPALPLLLLGVPLFDTGFVMARRIYYGKSPFVADRNHIHHQLLALKFDHYEAVVIIYLIQALFVTSAIFLRHHSDLTVVSTWLLANGALAAVLVAAGRMRWYARHSDSRSLIARVVTASHSRFLYKASVVTVNVSLVLILLAGPFLVSEVGMDFGLAAGGLFSLLVLRLLFGYRAWFVSLRLIGYVSIAFVWFLYASYPSDAVSIGESIEYSFFGLVVLALLIGSRYTVEEAFQATPMDFLLILVLAGLVFIPQAQVVEEYVIQLAIKIFILFYAIEFVLGNLKNRWSSLTVSMLCALAVIALRGLMGNY